jgi:hypothetical protein
MVDCGLQVRLLRIHHQPHALGLGELRELVQAAIPETCVTQNIWDKDCRMQPTNSSSLEALVR